jgi:glycosyltransferase involved in cell wall biosynthesis
MENKMESRTKPHKIVIWESLSNISGGQAVAITLIEQFKEIYQISAILPSEGPLSSNLEKKGIPVFYVPTGTYMLGGKKIIDILRFVWFTPSIIYNAYKITKGADLIYANSTRIFIWAAITGAVSNIPVVWHLHNLLVDRKSRFLIELSGRLKAVKKIIAVSHAAAGQFPALNHKIEVVHNGVDISKFKVNLQKEGLQRDQKHIGVISDLVPQKGHETLIKAAKLAKNQISLKFFIVGASRNNTGRYEKKLKNLVSELELNENIDFLGYRSDIPEILNTLDLLVVPSSSFEACPMVILEACACGVPVVGSDLGGTPELIEDGKTGFVFRANDEKDLAEKILLILNDSVLQSEMRKNCRKIAEEKFDLRIFSRNIKAILSEVLRGDNNKKTKSSSYK